MTIQELGSLGEILGAIGVIATLLYLTTQLKQNTKAMRSSTYQTYSGLAMNISDFLAENAELFVRMNAGKELSEEEQLRFSMFAMKLFYQMETIYLHYKEDTVSEEIFNSRMRGFKQAMTGNPAMYGVWDSFREWDLTDSFVHYVEENVFERDA